MGILEDKIKDVIERCRADIDRAEGNIVTKESEKSGALFRKEKATTKKSKDSNDNMAKAITHDIYVLEYEIGIHKQTISRLEAALSNDEIF